MAKIIDTHSHILPGIDDGAGSWKEALCMLKTAQAQGIRRVIATPHWGGPFGYTDPVQIRELCFTLQEKARRHNISVKIYQGQEVMYTEEAADRIANGEILTLADSRYVLAEFYMKLLKHQGFMIHASAVEKEGKAYLFSAPSGTGKSTHAQLWRQTFKGEPIRIINDDKPAVCLQNGVFYACGTPFSGKTDKNENRKAPIQGLCMLHRGKTNKIQKITSGEALPLILPQTLFYGDEEETNLLLSFLDRFLQSVPVYKMECTMEEEAAKTAYFCMKGEEK